MLWLRIVLEVTISRDPLLQKAYYKWETIFCTFFLSQLAELKARFDQSQEQLKQKKTRVEHLEKTVKQQQQELKRRTGQLADLERVSLDWINTRNETLRKAFVL